MNTINKKTNAFHFLILIRDGIYAAIGFLNKLFPVKKPRIIIYCYHSISSDGWRFSVTEESFKEQIKYLLNDKIPLKVSDLPDYINGEKRLTRDAFVITFDDGYEDILTVKDFLSEVNIHPTVFVLSDTDKADRGELETGRSFLSDNQIIDLQKYGWEIGSHSATHPNFKHLSQADIKYEVFDSKLNLEKRLNFPVLYFAYPKGVYTDAILSIIKSAGYSLAFSMDDEYITSHTNRYIVPRVGVDGTHTMNQFKYLALPLSLLVRKVLKKIT